jgi:dolichol-phosphate mannosyltransferase
MTKQTKQHLISVCIPVLNEKDNIHIVCKSIVDVFGEVSEFYTFEIILTDNNSTDGTWEEILRVQKLFPQIRAYRFRKNVGFQQSILFNLKHAKGSAAIQIDADLQDPPYLFLDFLSYWREGYKIVYGKRIERAESLLKQKFRKFGYKIIKVMSNNEIPESAGDFRLIDREIIEILKTVRAPDPYLRGFIASLGYEAKGVPYNRDSRKFGSSKFSLYKIVRLGLSGLFNHSAFPAKFSGLVSILALSGTLLLLIYVFLSKILGSPVPSGWAFLSILVLLGIGINSFLLWIISYYIFMLYKIALGEPKILLSSELGVDGEKQKLLNKGL